VSAAQAAALAEASAPPPVDDGAAWRVQVLRRLLVLLSFLLAPLVPLGIGLPAKVTLAATWLVLLVGALRLRRPAQLNFWAVVFTSCGFAVYFVPLFRTSYAPGPNAMLGMLILALNATVFLGPRGLLVALGAEAGLLLLLGELVQRGLLDTPRPVSFDDRFAWYRLVAGVLVLCSLLSTTVTAVLHRYQRGLLERGQSIDELRRQEAERQAEEQARDRAAASLARAQKLELVGQLAGSVAHDFNNALVVILSWTDVLRDESTSGAERAEAAEAIDTAAGRASALARQLVSLGRLQPDDRGREELAQLARELARTCSRLLPLSIEVRTGPLAPGAVSGSAAQLEQVLLNFALNARDAMPAGGALTLEVGPATAAERAGLQPGRYLALRVRDTGSGMDEATQARLFEPFFSTKGEGRGLGLGLASAAGIAQAHGGRVHVESARGAGSTFALVLPQAPDQPEPRSAEAPQARAPARRLLLVDDEAPVRRAMSRALQAGGFQVTEAGDCAGAVAAAERGPAFDLLCIDGVLPDGPAQRAVDAFLLRHPGAAVLVCSGHVDPGSLRARVATGRAAFLAKPFDRAVLVRKIEGLLASGSGQPIH
jgi:signal transduction histidine kinase